MCHPPVIAEQVQTGSSSLAGQNGSCAVVEAWTPLAWLKCAPISHGSELELHRDTRDTGAMKLPSGTLTTTRVPVYLSIVAVARLIIRAHSHERIRTRTEYSVLAQVISQEPLLSAR